MFAEAGTLQKQEILYVACYTCDLSNIACTVLSRVLLNISQLELMEMHLFPISNLIRNLCQFKTSNVHAMPQLKHSM